MTSIIQATASLAKSAYKSLLGDWMTSVGGAQISGILALFLGFSVTLASPVLADSPFEPLIREALAANPEIQAARRRWDAARQRVAQVSALMDPMIGAELMRRESTALSDYETLEWMASQRLSGLGKRGALAQEAEQEAAAAGFEYLETVRDVRAQVISACWDLWAASQKASLVRDFGDIANQSLEAAVARMQAGFGNLADVLRGHVELAKLSDDYITQLAQIRVSQTALNALLNTGEDTPRAPVESVPEDRPLPSVEELLEQARRNTAVLRALERRIASRQAAARVARLAYVPDVELVVKARQPRGSGGIEEFDTGVAITFPWLWRGKVRSQIAEAQALTAAAQAEFDGTLNKLAAEIVELHAKADAALRRARLIESELRPKARQVVDLTLAAYRQGRADFFSLLDAQREALRLDMEYVESRAEVGRAVARLERMTSSLGDDMREVEP